MLCKRWKDFFFPGIEHSRCTFHTHRLPPIHNHKSFSPCNIFARYTKSLKKSSPLQNLRKIMSMSANMEAVGAASPGKRCAACKNQRRKCSQDCILAPYFPATDPQRYACVQRIFGASNIARVLQVNLSLILPTASVFFLQK